MPETQEYTNMPEGNAQEDTISFSSSVNEIISNRPDRFVREGTGIIIVVIIALLTATWFIKYPDTIKSTAVLTAINAPKPLIPKIQGKLTGLRKQNGATVTAGTVIGVLETTASTDTILKLQQTLSSMEKWSHENQLDSLTTLVATSGLAGLGELQPSYQTFLQACLNFTSYSGRGIYIAKRHLLQQDIVRLQKARSVLSEQKQLFGKDLGLTRATFEANERLIRDRVISQQEYRELNSKLISKQMNLPQIESALIGNEAQINDKQKEILELDNQTATQQALFYEALQTLKSQLAEWKQKYLLIAPISGHLHFTRLIQENQQVQAGRPLAFIVPDNTTYLLEATLPQSNFGKMKQGLNVLVKFPAYPWQEYGIVKGQVKQIATIASDSNGYMVQIALPDGLKTDQGKQVQYREGLIANIEIITKEQRLLEKLYRSVVPATE